jgi:hypothetical protein
MLFTHTPLLISFNMGLSQGQAHRLQHHVILLFDIQEFSSKVFVTKQLHNFAQITKLGK